MEDCGGADPQPAPCGAPHAKAGGQELQEAATQGEPTQEQAPGRKCSLWRGVHRFPGSTLTWGESTLGQSAPDGLYLTKGPAVEQFLKNCSLWEEQLSLGGRGWG